MGLYRIGRKIQNVCDPFVSVTFESKVFDLVLNV